MIGASAGARMSLVDRRFAVAHGTHLAIGASRMTCACARLAEIGPAAEPSTVRLTGRGRKNHNVEARRRISEPGLLLRFSAIHARGGGIARGGDLGQER